MNAQRLKTIPLFSGLSKRQLEQLAGWIDEVDLPAGKQLLGEGTFAYEFVMIESGSASVSIDGQHVNDLGAGDFFGEIALLSTPRRTASVETTSPMRAAVTTGANFRAMIREFPEIETKVRVAMEERLRRTGETAHEH
jgi:CRP/FNR family cyclic AMP-dependent transcriptional regulator